jgi:protein SCO1
MKFSTLSAILICTLLPLFSYLVIKNYTDNHVIMPKKYFIDYVAKDTVDGKIKTDTFYHRVKNLQLVNQFGDTVSLNDVKGKVLLVNFFFTHCPTICPTITSNLQKLQKAVAKDSAMQMISITLDPKNDTTKRLFQYANQYGIKHDNWWMCRLVNDTLEKVLYKEFKSGFQKDSGQYEITHSPDVYLLDKNRIIRGKHAPSEITPENPDASKFYNGLDSNDLFKLMNDASLVKMEKTVRTKPPFGILIASMSIMGAVFFWLMYRYKKAKKLALTIKQ